MYHQLTKPEKKIARACIDKGVNAEFRAGMEKAKKVISEWENGRLDNREAYHSLYKKITDHDKRIGKRYDGLSGSDYLVTVAAIYYDGQITEDDMEGFTDETKAVIDRWISVWNEMK